MIKTSDVTEKVVALYTVPNPQYYQMIKAGKNPRFHNKNKNISSRGSLPPGAAYWSAVDGRKLDRGDSMKSDGLAYPNSVLEMRDYQKEPIEFACDVRCAMIEAPTGSGKSAMAAKIISESGQKSLVLCHSVELMLQMAQEVEDFLGEEPSIYYGKKGCKNLSDVTVSTYMSAIQNFEEFSEHGFNLLIIDEADLFTTDKYLKFLCEFQYKRVFGFTATTFVEKYDANMRGKMSLMDRLWGLKIEVKTEMQTDILDKIIFTSYEKTYTDKYDIPIISKEWALFRKHLDEDEERKKQQIDLVCGSVDSGDSAIVLLDRTADVEKYYDEISFKSPLNVYRLYGSMSDKLRKEEVANFKKTGGILVANVKIAGRGFNVVSANKAFIFCPMRGETPLRQAVGRILRWIPDKKATLFDWIDSSLAGQVRKRKRVYDEFYPNAEFIS